jgi:hypothetical protein
MKRTAAIACLTLALLASARAADPAGAQDQQLVAIVKEIQAQQVAIADNQTKIDAKLVTVAEAVRTARIYASRGGH